MKKLLAILLALMLLPAAALAQSEAEKYFGIDMSEMNEKRVENVIKQCDKIVLMAQTLKAEAQQKLAEMKGENTEPSEFEKVFKEIGDGIKNPYWEYDSCEPSYDMHKINIRYNGDSYWDNSSLLIAAVEYAIDFQRATFARDDVPQIVLQFIEYGRDKYGQRVDMTTITMRMTKERTAKLDLDYFREYAYSRQLDYLNAIDGYSLHREYKSVAK